MTGDLGSEAGRERSRPSFLPPVDGYPPPREEEGDPAPEAPAAQPRRGTVWILATITSAAALLVSAFLPWAHARIVIELFGRPIGRDLGSLAGIDSHSMVLAVPVLAVVAIGLAFWDLIGRDSRLGSLSAIPGTLSLLVCGVFVLRLGDVRDKLPQTGLNLGYQITVRYGWYMAVIASLLVVGFSLARPVAERLSGPKPHPDGYRPEHPQAEQLGWQYGEQQYGEQQYGADPYAVWPREDQAWGRAEREAPRDTDEPKEDQS